MLEQLKFRQRLIYLRVLIFISLFCVCYGQKSSRSSVRGDLKCNSTLQFSCNFSQRCIPKTWVCDGDDDCLDGADEQQCANKTCAPGEFKCNNQRCIPNFWVCDNEDDCGDKTDEHKNCSALTSADCRAGQFFCNDSNMCIELNRKCDGIDDCPNNEDERNCPSSKPIVCNKPNEYLCKNGRKCIPRIWLCDEDDDCGDNSDESYNCTSTCRQGEFQCKTELFNFHQTRRCIPDRWVCDGEVDCRDGSDENECQSPLKGGHLHMLRRCRPNVEFQCADGFCIHLNWKCDGDFDCPDKSDETNCPIHDCTVDEFPCNDTKKCIAMSKKCDGRSDCSDDSDEANCPKPTTKKPVKCNETIEFDCSFGYCIDLAKVCDGNNDCPKGLDEKNCTKTDHCANFKCPSQQSCVSTKTGPICNCNPGFTKDQKNNNSTCIDIDECLNKTLCSQHCRNLNGSYRCACQTGYILDKDRHNCLAMGSRPKLWVTSKTHVREIDLTNRTMNHGRPMLESLQFAVAMDFHIKKNYVAWSDIGPPEAIFICELKPNSIEPLNATLCKKPIVSGNISTPDGLAIDWIHDLLYWTDAEYNTISVINLDGTHRTTLISHNLDQPRAIALDPRKGIMFWTDWGTNAKIESAGMDGSGRRELVTNPTDVQWPNGLTLDLVKEQLYWADAKLRHIMRCDYNGDNKLKVVSSSRDLKHPFGLSVFENKVYWSDWETEGIHYANKLDGSGSAVMARYVFGTTTIRVYHSMAQPPANENKCLNHGCDHVCAPTTHKVKLDTYRSYSCLCADGFVLTSNTTGKCQFLIDELKKEESNGWAVIGLWMSLFVAIASFVCCVGWVLWKRQRKNEHLRWTFGNMLYRNGADVTNVNNVDSYDHLRLSFDEARNFNDVYQPTTTTNYVLNVANGGGRSNMNSKDSMKLPLTENMYDDC